MPIYVNTDNSNDKKKLFIATGLSNAAAVETKMQEVVIATIRKDAAADFTTDKPDKPKGYSLRLKVVTKKEGRETTYTVPIEILRYPPEVGKGGKGEYMVPIDVTLGHATMTGNDEAEILDVVAQLTKSAVKAAINPMRIDMTRR
jgi:hypothetical protein